MYKQKCEHIKVAEKPSVICHFPSSFGKHKMDTITISQIFPTLWGVGERGQLFFTFLSGLARVWLKIYAKASIFVLTANSLAH